MVPHCARSHTDARAHRSPGRRPKPGEAADLNLDKKAYKTIQPIFPCEFLLGTSLPARENYFPRVASTTPSSSPVLAATFTSLPHLRGL
jgi:hypothetical protein